MDKIVFNFNINQFQPNALQNEPLRNYTNINFCEYDL